MTATKYAVVGAGIVGVMTALELAKQGCQVTLYDGWEPGHNRAASSDHHRITRSAHGSDELYTRWQYESRLRWLELGRDWGIELFRQTGGLLLAETGNSVWEEAAFPTLERLGIPAMRFLARRTGGSLSPHELSQSRIRPIRTGGWIRLGATCPCQSLSGVPGSRRNLPAGPTNYRSLGTTHARRATARRRPRSSLPPVPGWARCTGGRWARSSR